MNGRRDDRHNTERVDDSTKKPERPCFDPSKPLAQLVNELAEGEAERYLGGKDSLSSSQLRRFFGEVKDLRRRLDARSNYHEIEPLFKMLKSKAKYAEGLKKIPVAFSMFIENGVNKVTKEDEFRHFVRHFEAVVGFLYGSGKVSDK